MTTLSPVLSVQLPLTLEFVFVFEMLKDQEFPSHPTQPQRSKALDALGKL